MFGLSLAQGERRRSNRTEMTMRRIGLVGCVLIAGCITEVQQQTPPAVDVPVDTPPGSTPPPSTPPPECQIQADQEHGPGWPFTLATFREQILPNLIADCSGCHIPPNGPGGFSVWADAAPGNCSYAKT